MGEVLVGHVHVEDSGGESDGSPYTIPVYVDDTKVKTHDLPETFHISCDIMLNNYHYSGGLLRVERIAMGTTP